MTKIENYGRSIWVDLKSVNFVDEIRSCTEDNRLIRYFDVGVGLCVFKMKFRADDALCANVEHERQMFVEMVEREMSKK